MKIRTPILAVTLIVVLAIVGLLAYQQQWMSGLLQSEKLDTPERVNWLMDVYPKIGPSAEEQARGAIRISMYDSTKVSNLHALVFSRLQRKTYQVFPTGRGSGPLVTCPYDVFDVTLYYKEGIARIDSVVSGMEVEVVIHDAFNVDGIRWRNVYVDAKPY